MNQQAPVLVTGATGYVGGRLVPRLLAAGMRVRAMGRSLEKLACRPWAGAQGVELVQGDLSDPESVYNAAMGCRAAFYLVHSMIAQKKRFAAMDRRSAHIMKDAAEKAGLEQIIYLGGLGDIRHPNLSPHLTSRHEVADILQSGSVPTTVLRAAMILGSGSASFEILRYLVERLPIMITPRWVSSPTQPIAIGDVLHYLVSCLQHDQTMGKTFDIGGPDVLTYKDLIRIYAQEARLPRRRIIPVPLLTPRLSAKWIHLVTPIPASIALPLTEGLSVPTICNENRIRQIIPLNLISCRQAIRSALSRVLEEQVETCWTDAGRIHAPEWLACGDAEYAGGTILSCAYRMLLDAPADAVWKPVGMIGGTSGYYFADWLWELRGAIDRLMGGVGLNRGRRHASQLLVGDALDFWRVLRIEPNQRLTLLAEMKTPGDAVLDVQVQALNSGQSELRLISRFLPRGLGGLIYWYALYPFHMWLFRGMLRSIAHKIGSSRSGRVQRMDAKAVQSCALGARPGNRM